MTAASPFPLPTEHDSAEPRSAEPSMEEILASIRRIISDDHLSQAKSGTGAAEPTEALEPRPVAAALPRTSERVAPFPRAAGDLLELPRYPSPVAARPGAAGGRTSFAYGGEIVAAVPAPDLVALDEVRGPQPAPSSPPTRLTPEAVSISSALPVNPRLAETLGGRNGEPRVAAALTPSAPEPAVSATGEGGSADALLSPVLGKSVMSAFETLAASVVLRNEAALTATMRDMLRPLLKTWLDDHLPTLVERLVRVEIERVARGGRD